MTASFDPAKVGPPGRERFVGRTGALERAEQALAAARDGAGRVLWIDGEPGIGKTRLLRELARRAAELGLAVHAGRCLEEAGASPCWPWTQILRGCVEGLAPPEVGERYGVLAGEALQLLPERAPAFAASASEAQEDGRRLRLFDAVAALLGALSRERPLLLAIDDLHRADATSALLLRHLLRELERAPVAFALACRDEQVGRGHALAPALAELRPDAERIRLDGLAEPEVAELAHSLTGQWPHGALRRELHERTAGNPLFVCEIARDLAERGGLARPDAVREAAAGAPAGLRQVIRGRIARLPGPAEDLLERAAVIGREFSVEVLAWASGLRGDELRPTLEAALGARLLEPGPAHGLLRFGHVLVRDALYEDLAPMRRVALHRAVGLALEGVRGGSDDEPIDELALHFGAAATQGEALRAWRYARRAGERALARLAYDEAAERFEAALRALALVPMERASGAQPAHHAQRLRERAELCVLLGRAHWRAGATEPARTAFAEAAELARIAEAPDLLARAALGYAGRTDATPGVNRVAVAFLEEALEALPEADTPLRSELLARLGTELYYDPERRRSDLLTRDALEMAQRVGDGEALAYALSARGYALMRPDVDPRARLALAERQLALAERADARDVAAIGLQERIVALLELGDGPRLDAALHDYASRVEALGQPFFRWMSAAFTGMRALLDGRVVDAERLAEVALGLGQRCGTPNALPAFSAQLFHIRREQGRLAELEPLLRRMLDQDPFAAAFRAGLCVIHAETGRAREASGALAQLASAGLDEAPLDQHWLGLVATLARACARLRDAATAQLLHAKLRPYDGRIVVLGHGVACDGAVAYHLANLAVACGDLDLASHHYEAALLLHRRAGARLHGAHGQRELAQVLRQRDRPGDRARAGALLAEAASTYRALGFAARARELALD